MRSILVLLSLAAAGCAPNETQGGSPRTDVQRDVEGYAVASCLTNQAEPYLKDQGDAWAFQTHDLSTNRREDEVHNGHWESIDSALESGPTAYVLKVETVQEDPSPKGHEGADCR